METNPDLIHSERSSYREMLIEHLFAGDLMRHFWRRKSGLLEVAKPQVDDGGYDSVIESSGIVRHIQLKSSFVGSSLRSANIALALAAKPSGCVLVVWFSKETLSLGPFQFFGGAPGSQLPDISGFPVTRNTRRNSSGKRQERPAHRCVQLSKFEKLSTLAEVAEKLFGGGAA